MFKNIICDCCGKLICDENGYVIEQCVSDNGAPYVCQTCFNKNNVMKGKK